MKKNSYNPVDLSLEIKNEYKKSNSLVKFIDFLSEKEKVRILRLADIVLNLKYENFYKISMIKFPKESFEKIKEKYKKSISYEEIKNSLKTREYFLSSRNKSIEESSFEEIEYYYTYYVKNKQKEIEKIQSTENWLKAGSVFVTIISLASIPFTANMSVLAGSLINGIIGSTSISLTFKSLSILPPYTQKEVLKELNTLLKNYTKLRLRFLENKNEEIIFSMQVMLDNFEKENKYIIEKDEFLEYLLITFKRNLLYLKNNSLNGYTDYYGKY